jgi:hypothetical protein
LLICHSILLMMMAAEPEIVAGSYTIGMPGDGGSRHQRGNECHEACSP